jgi:UDP-GlcNAc:undecaprenyl-phosphate GlcNAc-1-phosphate transferase
VTGGGWQYLAVFLVSAAFSLLLTPLVLRFALRRNVLDLPGGHKSHADPVPYLGGLAIVAAFALTVVVAALVRPPVSGRGELFVVLGLAVLLAFVGLLDDLTGLSPVVRSWSRPAPASPCGPSGWHRPVRARRHRCGDHGAVGRRHHERAQPARQHGRAVVRCRCDCRRLDLRHRAQNGQFLVAGLAIGLAAARSASCATTSIRRGSTWETPARFLGFMLAYLGMKLRFDAPTSTTFLVPILIMGVPIFDTTLVTVTRLRRG